MKEKKKTGKETKEQREENKTKELYVVFIQDVIGRLKKDCSIEDLKQIQLKVLEIWGKYHNINEITVK